MRPGGKVCHRLQFDITTVELDVWAIESGNPCELGCWLDLTKERKIKQVIHSSSFVLTITDNDVKLDNKFHELDDVISRELAYLSGTLQPLCSVCLYLTYSRLAETLFVHARSVPRFRCSYLGSATRSDFLTIKARGRSR